MVEFTINTSRNRATVGLYISKRKDWYTQLKNQESDIAEELGETIEWSEGEKDGRMLLPKKLGRDFEAKNYHAYYEWFMEKAILLRKIAKQYNND